MGLTHQNINVLFKIDAGQQNSTASYRTQEGTPPPKRAGRLNSKYTFASFIVGSSNQLAYAAALEIAKNPGHTYNPLFIYGGVGLGKTHLLHAIGHAFIARNVQVLYVSAEQFTNEFVNAIRDRKMEEFRNKYRSAGMLLIDDIHFISGKEQTEEGFFHTFNELHNANRQIAITSNCPPKAIPLLPERLCSRFEWGLVTDIQPPDFETRLGIVQAKAEQSGVKIAPDIIELIAQQARQNIRELEGSINRVIAYARLLRAPVTIELAIEALKDIASKKPKSARSTPALIIEAVANSFMLAPEDLKSGKKDRGIVLARQVAMYLIKQETNYSLAQIGQELGKREPITVSHACKKIANNINADPDLRNKLSEIQQRICLASPQ